MSIVAYEVRQFRTRQFEQKLNTDACEVRGLSAGFPPFTHQTPSSIRQVTPLPMTLLTGPPSDPSPIVWEKMPSTEGKAFRVRRNRRVVLI